MPLLFQSANYVSFSLTMGQKQEGEPSTIADPLKKRKCCFLQNTCSFAIARYTDHHEQSFGALGSKGKKQQ